MPNIPLSILRSMPFALLVFVTATAGAVEGAISLDQALQLQDKPVVTGTDDSSSDALAGKMNQSKNDAQQARTNALVTTATGLGVKLGLTWQLTNINNAIKKDERSLDTAYDFGIYMIQDRVVPPVITEMRDVYTQDGDYTLRLSGAAYKIENQARFSSVSPTWRNYLTFPLPEVTQSSVATLLKPRDESEATIWRTALKEGWYQGVEQANIMLEYGFDRMNRDLLGMMRFHTFVRQGKISMPAIAYERMDLALDGATLAIDEKLLRITTLSQFSESIQTWKASISMSPQAAPVGLMPISASKEPSPNAGAGEGTDAH